MQDPRLNSIHLPAPRREQFRAARSDLLNACGNATIAAERPPTGSQHTAILDQDKRFPPGILFVLVEKECVYPLKVGINTIGRMPDNDVVLADPYVSRRHVAVLIHAHNHCELHDIASKNGTLLNGKALSGRTELHPGDQIQISDHILLFLSRPGVAEERPNDHTMAE
jgi:pSer/pThr/pTyr-binding forkhead associated (FHA) protein